MHTLRQFIGGAELIAHAQAKILKKRGYEVLVFAGMPDDRGKRYRVKKDVLRRDSGSAGLSSLPGLQRDYMNFFHKELNDLFGQ